MCLSDPIHGGQALMELGRELVSEPLPILLSDLVLETVEDLETEK
jgi:hypothetical protein